MDVPNVDVPPTTVPASPATDAYVAALDAATAAISDAIAACLQRPDEWRFQDVQRLCKIAQAVARMRARNNPRVGAYVDQHDDDAMRPDRCFPMGARNLGGVAVDPLDDPLLGPQQFPFVRGPLNGNGGYGALLPQQQRGPMDGLMDGVRGALEQIGNKNEHDAEERARIDRLNELKKLRDLLKGTDLPDEERKALEERRAEVLAIIIAQTERDKSAREHEATQPPPQSDVYVRCLQCGTAHDADWVTPEGHPRNCDVCGQPMIFGTRGIHDNPEYVRALPPGQ